MKQLRGTTLALGALLAVVAVRSTLDPVLGERLPYVLFCIASIPVAWLGGVVPGLVVLAAGWAIGSFLWVAPRGFVGRFESAALLVQSVLYLGVGSALVVLTDAARRIRARAGAAAHELERDRRARAASEERFRKLAEAVDDAFYVADPNTGGVLYLSPAFERIWQIPAAAVVADTRVWARTIHPDDVHLTERGLARARSDGSYAATYRILRPDGAVRWVRDRATAMDGGLVAGIATDVTGEIAADATRREREERLRVSETSLQTALDLVGMATWTVDLRTEETRWSERHFQLLGLDPASVSPSVEAWIASIHPDDRERVAGGWQQARSVGAPFRETYRVVWPDGRVRWVEARGGFLEDDDGRPVVGTGAFHDVTEHKLASEARERLLERTERLRVEAEVARAEAERASVSKDHFLAVLSHELRSPLQGMIGWLALLRSGRLDADRSQQGLEAIERNVRLQAQLVSDLLDVSRIVADKMQLNVGVVDLGAIVEATVADLRPVAQRSSVALRGSTTPGAMVAGDAERLHQVVANLLANAIKFTPAGGTVDVRCMPVGDAVELTVEDTGEGIAPDALPRIFDRFAQADSSPTRRHGGLGLGLAIVKHLTEAHGGRVVARSAGVGRGSAFVVRLPLVRTVDLPLHDRPAEPPPKDAVLDGVGVLLVEDDEASRESLALALEESGARVVQASSAAGAIEAFRAHRPEVVISDLGMAPVDGYGFLDSLRALDAGRAVPVIALTGFASAEDRARVAAAGFQGHLPKPTHPDAVVGTILRTLAAARSEPTRAPRTRE